MLTLINYNWRLKINPDERKEFLLSVVVPVYNEEKTVEKVINTLLKLNIKGGIDLIVINDGSTDRTSSILNNYIEHQFIRILNHEVNSGKGQAVRNGIKIAKGSHILVFDADSEYDPQDIESLITPILNDRADVVYGVRLRGQRTLLPTLVHALGNRAMTALLNIIYGTAISDLHTCLKLLPLPLVRNMTLKEKGFGLDTEITCEMLRQGYRPFEIPISYVGRSKEEGKKIKFSDALECVFVIIKVRLRPKTTPGKRDRKLAPKVS